MTASRVVTLLLVAALIGALVAGDIEITKTPSPYHIINNEPQLFYYTFSDPDAYFQKPVIICLNTTDADLAQVHIQISLQSQAFPQYPTYSVGLLPNLVAANGIFGLSGDFCMGSSSVAGVMPGDRAYFAINVRPNIFGVDYAVAVWVQTDPTVAGDISWTRQRAATMPFDVPTAFPPQDPHRLMLLELPDTLPVDRALLLTMTDIEPSQSGPTQSSVQLDVGTAFYLPITTFSQTAPWVMSFRVATFFDGTDQNQLRVPPCLLAHFVGKTHLPILVTGSISLDTARLTATWEDAERVEEGVPYRYVGDMGSNDVRNLVFDVPDGVESITASVSGLVEAQIILTIAPAAASLADHPHANLCDLNSRQAQSTVCLASRPCYARRVIAPELRGAAISTRTVSEGGSSETNDFKPAFIKTSATTTPTPDPVGNIWKPLVPTDAGYQVPPPRAAVGVGRWTVTMRVANPFVRPQETLNTPNDVPDTQIGFSTGRSEFDLVVKFGRVSDVDEVLALNTPLLAEVGEGRTAQHRLSLTREDIVPHAELRFEVVLQQSTLNLWAKADHYYSIQWYLPEVFLQFGKPAGSVTEFRTSRLTCRRQICHLNIPACELGPGDWYLGVRNYMTELFEPMRYLVTVTMAGPVTIHPSDVQLGFVPSEYVDTYALAPGEGMWSLRFEGSYQPAVYAQLVATAGVPFHPELSSCHPTGITASSLAIAQNIPYNTLFVTSDGETDAFATVVPLVVTGKEQAYYGSMDNPIEFRGLAYKYTIAADFFPLNTSATLREGGPAVTLSTGLVRVDISDAPRDAMVLIQGFRQQICGLIPSASLTIVMTASLHPLAPRQTVTIPFSNAPERFSLNATFCDGFLSPNASEFYMMVQRYAHAQCTPTVTLSMATMRPAPAVLGEPQVVRLTSAVPSAAAAALLALSVPDSAREPYTSLRLEFSDVGSLVPWSVKIHSDASVLCQHETPLRCEQVLGYCGITITPCRAAALGSTIYVRIESVSTGDQSLPAIIFTSRTIRPETIELGAEGVGVARGVVHAEPAFAWGVGDFSLRAAQVDVNYFAVAVPQDLPAGTLMRVRVEGIHSDTPYENEFTVVPRGGDEVDTADFPEAPSVSDPWSSQGDMGSGAPSEDYSYSYSYFSSFTPYLTPNDDQGVHLAVTNSFDAPGVLPAPNGDQFIRGDLCGATVPQWATLVCGGKDQGARHCDLTIPFNEIRRGATYYLGVRGLSQAQQAVIYDVAVSLETPVAPIELARNTDHFLPVESGAGAIYYLDIAGDPVGTMYHTRLNTQPLHDVSGARVLLGTAELPINERTFDLYNFDSLDHPETDYVAEHIKCAADLTRLWVMVPGNRYWSIRFDQIVPINIPNDGSQLDFEFDVFRTRAANWQPITQLLALNLSHLVATEAYSSVQITLLTPAVCSPLTTANLTIQVETLPGYVEGTVCGVERPLLTQPLVADCIDNTDSKFTLAATSNGMHYFRVSTAYFSMDDDAFALTVSALVNTRVPVLTLELDTPVSVHTNGSIASVRARCVVPETARLLAEGGIVGAELVFVMTDVTIVSNGYYEMSVMRDYEQLEIDTPFQVASGGADTVRAHINGHLLDLPVLHAGQVWETELVPKPISSYEGSFTLTATIQYPTVLQLQPNDNTPVIFDGVLEYAHDIARIYIDFGEDFVGSQDIVTLQITPSVSNMLTTVATYGPTGRFLYRNNEFVNNTCPQLWFTYYLQDPQKCVDFSAIFGDRGAWVYLSLDPNSDSTAPAWFNITVRRIKPVPIQVAQTVDMTYPNAYLFTIQDKQGVRVDYASFVANASVHNGAMHLFSKNYVLTYAHEANRGHLLNTRDTLDSCYNMGGTCNWRDDIDLYAPLPVYVYVFPPENVPFPGFYFYQKSGNYKVALGQTMRVDLSQAAEITVVAGLAQTPSMSIYVEPSVTINAVYDEHPMSTYIKSGRQLTSSAPEPMCVNPNIGAATPLNLVPAALNVAFGVTNTIVNVTVKGGAVERVRLNMNGRLSFDETRDLVHFHYAIDLPDNLKPGGYIAARLTPLRGSVSGAFTVSDRFNYASRLDYAGCHTHGEDCSASTVFPKPWCDIGFTTVELLPGEDLVFHVEDLSVHPNSMFTVDLMYTEPRLIEVVAGRSYVIEEDNSYNFFVLRNGASRAMFGVYATWDGPNSVLKYDTRGPIHPGCSFANSASAGEAFSTAVVVHYVTSGRGTFTLSRMPGAWPAARLVPRPTGFHIPVMRRPAITLMSPDTPRADVVTPGEMHVYRFIHPDGVDAVARVEWKGDVRIRMFGFLNDDHNMAMPNPTRHEILFRGFQPSDCFVVVETLDEVAYTIQYSVLDSSVPSRYVTVMRQAGTYYAEYESSYMFSVDPAAVAPGEIVTLDFLSDVQGLYSSAFPNFEVFVDGVDATPPQPCAQHLADTDLLSSDVNTTYQYTPKEGDFSVNSPVCRVRVLMGQSLHVLVQLTEFSSMPVNGRMVLSTQAAVPLQPNVRFIREAPNYIGGEMLGAPRPPMFVANNSVPYNWRTSELETSLFRVDVPEGGQLTVKMAFVAKTSPDTKLFVAIARNRLPLFYGENPEYYPASHPSGTDLGDYDFYTESTNGVLDELSTPLSCLQGGTWYITVRTNKPQLAFQVVAAIKTIPIFVPDVDVVHNRPGDVNFTATSSTILEIIKFVPRRDRSYSLNILGDTYSLMDPTNSALSSSVLVTPLLDTAHGGWRTTDPVYYYYVVRNIAPSRGSYAIVLSESDSGAIPITVGEIKSVTYQNPLTTPTDTMTAHRTAQIQFTVSLPPDAMGKYLQFHYSSGVKINNVNFGGIQGQPGLICSNQSTIVVDTFVGQLLTNNDDGMYVVTDVSFSLVAPLVIDHSGVFSFTIDSKVEQEIHLPANRSVTLRVSQDTIGSLGMREFYGNQCDILETLQYQPAMARARPWLANEDKGNTFKIFFGPRSTPRRVLVHTEPSVGIAYVHSRTVTVEALFDEDHCAAPSGLQYCGQDAPANVFIEFDSMAEMDLNAKLTIEGATALTGFAIDGDCLAAVRRLTCMHYLPPCHPTLFEPLGICADYCEAVESACDISVRLMLNISRSLCLPPSETQCVLLPSAPPPPPLTSDVGAVVQPDAPTTVNHTGAIVGGVLGGLAGVVLIAGVAYYLVRRRLRKEGSSENSGERHSLVPAETTHMHLGEGVSLSMARHARVRSRDFSVNEDPVDFDSL